MEFKIFKRYLFALTIFFHSLQSPAYSCKNVFRTNWSLNHAEKVIEDINRDLFSAFSQEVAQFKVKAKLLNPNRLKTAKDYEQVASELYLLFYQKKFVDRFDNLWMSKDQKALEWAKRQIIEGGLKSFVSESSSSYKFTMMSKLSTILSKYMATIINLKLINSGGIPISLPSVEGHKIPKELIEKIILDGYESHKHEVERIYGSQNKYEIYKIVQSAYKAFAFALIIYLIMASMDELEKQQEALREKQRQQAFADLDRMSRALDMLNERLDKVLTDQGR